MVAPLHVGARPSAHAVHDVAPLLLEKCPVAHALHAPVPDLKRPATHMQVTFEVAPVLWEKRPTAHASHVAGPVLDLKRPAGHEVHASEQRQAFRVATETQPHRSQPALLLLFVLK